MLCKDKLQPDRRDSPRSESFVIPIDITSIPPTPTGPTARFPMFTWLRRVLSSSIGKKTGMALSGLALVGFLIVHLLGNLSILDSDSAFNAYAQKLEDLGPLLIVAEIGLLALFLFHITLALMVSLRNKGARSVGYRSKGSMGEKTLASRSMLVTGLLLGAFLVIHIIDFRLQKLMGTEGSENLGQLVRNRVTSPIGLGIYISAGILIGLHLSHGFKSAFQSLGLYHNKFNDTIRMAGYTIAIVLALGFIAIPVALYMGQGGPL